MYNKLLQKVKFNLINVSNDKYYKFKVRIGRFIFEYYLFKPKDFDIDEMNSDIEKSRFLHYISEDALSYLNFGDDLNKWVEKFKYIEDIAKVHMKKSKIVYKKLIKMLGNIEEIKKLNQDSDKHYTILFHKKYFT